MKKVLFIVAVLLGFGTMSQAQNGKGNGKGNGNGNGNARKTTVYTTNTAHAPNYHASDRAKEVTAANAARKVTRTHTRVIRKADGTPDRRYRTSRYIKRDGTPDRRYRTYRRKG